MKLTLGGFGLSLMIAACSSMAVQSGPPDAGTEPDAGTDASTGSPDSGGDMTPAFTKGPKLVFVNGVVTGTTSVSGLTLDDVRLCVRDATNTWANEDHPFPDATPMPLANYPGVRMGSGVDLGQFRSGPLEVDVFLASDLMSDSAWASPSVRAGYACSQITCAGTSLPCYRHVTLQVTPDMGTSVLALVDQSNDVGLVSRPFMDAVYNGTQSTLWGTVVDVSKWGSDATLNAYYGDPTASTSTDFLIAASLGVNGPKPQQLTASLTKYDGVGIRFDAVGDAGVARFGQSLDSIAFISDAALTPPQFYDVRQNFVFALVGDPNDTTSVLANGGRDPSFSGAGLHITAIPYSTPQ